MKTKKPLVLVLSRNYSTGLGVIRSLGAAGYDVDLIASTKKKGGSMVASVSKYVKHSMELRTRDIQSYVGDEWIKVLIEYKDADHRKMILFPTDDFTASIVAKNRDQLKGKYLIPDVSDQAPFDMIELMNKENQAELADKAGLRVASQWIISLEKRINLPKDIIYPCYVKPLQSIQGQKNEMKACDNQEELKSHLVWMKANYKNRSVLVQEYLTIDEEYCMSGICVESEVLIPAVIRKLNIASFEPGVTMRGEMLPSNLLGDNLDKVKEFLKLTHYNGMFDLELFECDGKIYFNELNLRSGGPNYAYYKNGINLPDLLLQRMSGDIPELPQAEPETYGRSFIYEKVAWEDYIHHYISKKELKQYLKETDDTLIKDKEDPKPGYCFEAKIRLSAYKQRLLEKKNRKEGKEKIKNYSRQSICVVGYNYCNIITMARALGSAGYRVAVIRVHRGKKKRTKILKNMHPESYSRYVQSYFEFEDNGHMGNIARKLVAMAEPGRKHLLIPVDDYSTAMMDRYLNLLNPYYFLPNAHGKQGVINDMMDKEKQKKIAATFGLPVLKSAEIEIKDHKYHIPEGITYPCFVKPKISLHGSKSQMSHCDNEEELNRLLKKLAPDKDATYLAEAFIPVRNEYSLLGVSTPEGVIIPGVFRMIKGGKGERKGVTLIGEIVDRKEFDELAEACQKFVESFRFTGMFDLDFIEDEDGNFYFLEINFRSGASLHIFTSTGINLPKILADYMLRHKWNPQKEYPSDVGRRFISEKILMEEYASGNMRLREAIQLMKEADICFVKDEKDKKPYRYFRRFYLFAVVRRVLVSIMNKIRRV